LLRARLADDADHVYSWHHLGHALDGLGDEEGARAAWLHGIEAARRHPGPSPVASLPYLDLVQRDMTRGVDVTALLDEMVARFPGHHLVNWLHARYLMRDGRFEEAVPLLEALAAVDSQTLVEDRLAYDARIFGVWPITGLALCCFRLGRF